MNENSDLLPNLQHEEFEMQMRGYSRRQVDEYVARRTSEIRELEHRLARALDESEHLRREISTVRQQALAGRPAHEEVSERVGQILKLAEDEAAAQRIKTEEDIAGLRNEAQKESEQLRAAAKQESERARTDAREQAERMLTAAQEQAERTISAARDEADKMRGSARTEADRLTTESRQQADSALSEAKSHAKRMLDEATARATAIHDGAERRLNLLSTRHSETVRRLTDILDGVQGLVAAEASRMSLEDEVNQAVSTAVAALEPAAKPVEGSGGERDRPMIAPPAPETKPTGVTGPFTGNADSSPARSADVDTALIRAVRPVTVHPVTLHPGSPPASGFTDGPDVDDEPDIIDVPDGSVTPGPAEAPGATGSSGPFPGPASVGRHATSMPPRSPMPRRFGAPPADTPLSSLPVPDGSPLSGPTIPGRPLADPYSPASRENRQDDSQAGPRHLIDPDEPTDGFRLMR